MVVNENAEGDANALVPDLKGLEIPADWLEQNTGTSKKTDPVDLAYLEQLANQVMNLEPMTYDSWHQALLSIYSRINNVAHKGAQALWISFLRKGMLSLQHLITNTTSATIATEVTKLVEQEWSPIVDAPEAHRASIYWHMGSPASRWYCDLARMLSGHAGITQEFIVQLGEEMIELVCKPFERVAHTIDRDDKSISHITEGVFQSIEGARLGSFPSPEAWAAVGPRVREKIAHIMEQLCSEKVE
ncbi:MAG: hypothetical protein HY817_03845 [Candidatus Abawacabacteria bacterium]|nr:hypothetical protein [Candidatus Abawacabacteria bacterium]